MCVEGFLTSEALTTGHLFIFPVRICIGTRNSLSTTGNPEIQYNKTKEMYTGCEIVMGNLEITMMDYTRDLSFLQVRLWRFTPSTEVTACVTAVNFIVSGPDKEK